MSNDSSAVMCRPTATSDKSAPARLATSRPVSETRFRPSPHPLAQRLRRGLWGITWLLLFRPSPRILLGWRRMLLRLFGARIGHRAVVHASVKIWAPWNLEMARHSCLSHYVDCYSVAPIRIGAYATISQYSFLCGAGHDPDSPEMKLTPAPITIGDHAWVAADVFVAPGVTIGEGAVVGARSSVFRNVPPWTIVVGSPARFTRMRAHTVAEAVRRANGASA